MIRRIPPGSLGRAILFYLAVSVVVCPEAAAQEGDGTTAAEAVTAPVELDGHVLFHVRGVSSFPAADRARRIREQLVAVAADRAIPSDAVQVVEGQGVSRIQVADRVIFSVVDADARMEQIDRPALATAHVLRMRQAIGAYRADRTPAALRDAAGKALAATLVLLAAMVAVSLVGRRIDRALAERAQAHLQPGGIESLRWVRAERIWDTLRGGLGALRAIARLGVALVYIGFVLAQFPWTRGLSSNMFAFALQPLELVGSGLIGHIPNLVFLAVLFLVFRLAVGLIRLFFDAVEHGKVTLGKFDSEWAQPTYKIARFAVIAFGLVVAYPYIPGSQTAAFQGVSLFAGVVFSLASSSAISNIIAGYMLLYRRAFKAGDRIKVGESVGDVIGTRMQVTHLRSVKNEELIIPNSQMLAAEVVNYSSLARVDGLILHTEVGIGYETSWRQVEAMLVEAAERTTGLGTEARPFVREKTLGDFAVIYELNVYCTNVHEMGALYAALHRNILDVFNEHGVQIMTPAYEGDPAEPKIVPPAEWGVTPAHTR